MSVRPVILAAAAVAAALLNISAAAGPAIAATTNQVVVPYADLDLANQAGRVTLDRRIAAAAGIVCGEFNPIELRRVLEIRACQAATIASVEPQRDAAIGLRGTVRVSSLSGIMRVSRAAN